MNTQPEQRMDGGWGRFISNATGGQVWMWRERRGWSLKGEPLSDNKVEKDYEPAPLTILSDEAREYLVSMAIPDPEDSSFLRAKRVTARKALVSVGLGLGGKPLPNEPKQDELWEKDGVRLYVNRVENDIAEVLVVYLMAFGAEVIHPDLTQFLREWHKIRNADGSDVKPCP